MPVKVAGDTACMSLEGGLEREPMREDSYRGEFTGAELGDDMKSRCWTIVYFTRDGMTLETTGAKNDSGKVPHLTYLASDNNLTSR
jgi:hypothetical protein